MCVLSDFGRPPLRHIVRQPRGPGEVLPLCPESVSLFPDSRHASGGPIGFEGHGPVAVVASLDLAREGRPSVGGRWTKPEGARVAPGDGLCSLGRPEPGDDLTWNAGSQGGAPCRYLPIATSRVG